jgi:hypothetical protein
MCGVCVAASPRKLRPGIVILVSGFVIAATAMATPQGLDHAERDFRLDHDDGYSHLIQGLSPAEGAVSYRYSPSILTIAAGIESCLYDRGGAATWHREPLRWPDAPAGGYYSRDVPAHIRWGNPAQKRVFLIFGSSYSTWDRGTWTNKTVSFLRQRFDEPHLVVFAGFLTPEFLELRARRPAANTQEPARDLYARLRAALEAWKSAGRIPRDAHVGIIGFSGGARRAVSLLAEDQRRSAQSPLSHQADPPCSAEGISPGLHTIQSSANPAADAIGRLERARCPAAGDDQPVLPRIRSRGSGHHFRSHLPRRA